MVHLPFIERVYVRPGDPRPYLTRFKLTPRTRWGQLYLHVFWQGDPDRDLHDHPWHFWTFPLRGYLEEYVGRVGAREVRTLRLVKPWRWHRRAAEHTHRVILSPLADVYGDQEHAWTDAVVTLVWHGPRTRSWGFHTERGWVHWRDYVRQRGLD